MAERSPTAGDTHDLSLVPEALRPFAEATSVDAVMKLVAAFGGTVVYIPHQVEVRGRPTRLAEVLGPELLETLIDLYGHGNFEVPRCARLLKHHRNRMMSDARLAGKTIAELAKQFGLHHRTVRRVTNFKRHHRAGSR